MCASPRCKSNAASLSYTAYCQKLCVWGRGGNLCNCNAAHFVGKRQLQQVAEDSESAPGQQSADEVEPWDDDDVLSEPYDWIDDENSTAPDDVWAEQSDDSPSSVLAYRRRRQPAIFLAVRRRVDAELLRDNAKKGKSQHETRLQTRRRAGVRTLNPLTRKPTTINLTPDTDQWTVVRKMTS